MPQLAVAELKPGPFGFKSAGHRLLVNVTAHPPEDGQAEAMGLSASGLPRHDHLVRGEEESRIRVEARALMDYAGHQPDEPSWTWTQIWVQECMPHYSLNWTARSSSIQGWKRCQWCSSPSRRWPSRSWGPFDIKSPMELWPSGTVVRQCAEKPLQ